MHCELVVVYGAMEAAVIIHAAGRVVKCGQILWSAKKNIHFLIVQGKNIHAQVVETKSFKCA